MEQMLLIGRATHLKPPEEALTGEPFRDGRYPWCWQLRATSVSPSHPFFSPSPISTSTVSECTTDLLSFSSRYKRIFNSSSVNFFKPTYECKSNILSIFINIRGTLTCMDVCWNQIKISMYRNGSYDITTSVYCVAKITVDISMLTS